MKPAERKKLVEAKAKVLRDVLDSCGVGKTRHRLVANTYSQCQRLAEHLVDVELSTQTYKCNLGPRIVARKDLGARMVHWTTGGIGEVDLIFRARLSLSERGSRMMFNYRQSEYCENSRP